MRPRVPEGSERGIALVIALLVLLVLSMLALVLMTTVTLESKIAGHSTREASALNVAEAGVSEALSQIRAQRVVLGNNPRAVAMIFNTAAGSVPVLGTDSTAVATLQPAGQWLNYTTVTRNPNTLTVQYRTDASRSVIYKYDQNTNPHIQTASGYNIYRVTSTGFEGADQRRIQAEFIQKPVQVLAKGAVVANVGIDFKGTFNVCGHNHSINTPINTSGRPPCDSWELGYGDLPGAWSSSQITELGAASIIGIPDTLQYRTGFYDGPWSVFNMTQADFYSWTGPAQWPGPGVPVGVVRIDNDAIPQNQSATVDFHGGDGEGLLYVDGDVTLNGTFSFKGLIYIEGDLQINGNAWILGGLVVKGKTTLKLANGTATVLYSADAIAQKISQYGGQFVNISWREL